MWNENEEQMRGAITFFCAVILVWGPGVARGQSWEPTYGPTGNTPYDLFAYNGRFFLNTYWGNYRSDDRGRTWQKLNLDTHTPFFQFCANGNKIYADNNFSVDGGDTWCPITALPPGIIKYVFDSSEIVAVAEQCDVFRSSDSGITWRSIRSNLPVGSAYGLVELNNQLYVDLPEAGIYKYSDADSTWSLCISGMPSYPYAFYSALETDGNSLYTSDLRKMYKLSAPYTQWDSIENGFSSDVAVQKIWIYGQNIWLGTQTGIYKSSLNNISWQLEAGSQEKNTWAIYVDSDTVYAGFNYNGLYKTSDNGQTWNWLYKGIYAGSQCSSLFANNQFLLAGGDESAISTDRCISWKRTDVPFINVMAWCTLGNDLYASSYNCWSDRYGHLYVSHDTGRTWVNSDSGIVKHEGDYVYELVSLNGYVYANYYGKLYRTSNNGINWEPLAVVNNSYEYIRAICVFHNKLFAGIGNMTGNGSIYSSSDNGQTWVHCCTLAFQGAQKFTTSSCAMYMTDCFHESVYISNDEGVTWSDIKSGLSFSHIQDICFAGDKLYAIPYNTGPYGGHIMQGVYQYHNNCWSSCNNGLNAQNLNVNCLATDGTFLYAGVDYDGVYRYPLLSNVNTVSLEENPLSLTLSPNPTTGQFTINANSISSLCIYDVYGHCILNRNISGRNENELHLDLSSCAKGIYFVQVNSENENVTKKIIIQ